MALNERVEESLLDAQANLRNALQLGARQEKPYVLKHIGDMISNIDNLIHITGLLETIDAARERDVLE